MARRKLSCKEHDKQRIMDADNGLKVTRGKMGRGKVDGDKEGCELPRANGDEGSPHGKTAGPGPLE